jgi:hypothetical protein
MQCLAENQCEYLFILEKYDLVGKLLKPGEAHNSYSDEDEEPNTSTSTPSEAKDGETEETETKQENADKPVEKTEANESPKEDGKPKEE